MHANLASLLMQDLDGIAHEIVVINNDPEAQYRPGRWSKLGRLFRDNPQIKLVNTRNDWMSIVRYAMVYMAHFDTVLSLDDDVVFLDKRIAADMYQTLMGLERYDIVSGWNTLWTKWTETECHYVSASLWRPELTQLTKTDTCGPGLSIFNKDLVLDARAQKYLIVNETPAAADMVLGLLPNMLWNGTTYAMPIYGRADFHPDYKKNALHELPDFYPQRLKRYKEMLQNGYQPVITREPLADDSPEMQLIRTLEPKVRKW